MPFFGQRVQCIIMASRNPKHLDAVLQEILMLIPQHQITVTPVFRVCETGASPNLPLTGDTLVTDEAFVSSKCDVIGYKVNFT